MMARTQNGLLYTKIRSPVFRIGFWEGFSITSWITVYVLKNVFFHWWDRFAVGLANCCNNHYVIAKSMLEYKKTWQSYVNPNIAVFLTLVVSCEALSHSYLETCKEKWWILHFSKLVVSLASSWTGFSKRFQVQWEKHSPGKHAFDITCCPAADHIFRDSPCNKWPSQFCMW